jgi:hypothetical protein
LRCLENTKSNTLKTFVSDATKKILKPKKKRKRNYCLQDYNQKKHKKQHNTKSNNALINKKKLEKKTSYKDTTRNLHRPKNSLNSNREEKIVLKLKTNQQR